MERKSFVFYRSFAEATEYMTGEQKALYYEAIINLALFGEELEINDPISKMAFVLVKPQIEANNKKYLNGCKGAEFGKLGGRPKKTEEENPKETPKKPQENPKKTPNVNENVNVNDNDNDNVNVNVNVNDNVITEKRKKFVKPTIEEIKAYCEERQNNIDADQFFNYYESNGWKVGSNSMKNWKATIRTWESRNKKTGGASDESRSNQEFIFDTI